MLELDLTADDLNFLPEDPIIILTPPTCPTSCLTAQRTQTDARLAGGRLIDNPIINVYRGSRY